jgi:RimJ/RimL family protein N-acetyltransferase
MTGDVSLRPAKIDDLETILEILQAAQSWLADRHIAQWNRPFTVDWLAPRIASGECWIAEQEGEPVGVCRLLWEDRLFWGERDQGESAYIHSFAIRRSHAGIGLGGQILTAIADLARNRSRGNLRLDCVAANHRLIAYYQSQDFAPVGDIDIGDAHMTLMERPL